MWLISIEYLTTNTSEFVELSRVPCVEEFISIRNNLFKVKEVVHYSDSINYTMAVALIKVI